MMKTQQIEFRRYVYFFLIVLLVAGVMEVTMAQQLRWLSVSDLQYPVNSIGANYENESSLSVNQNGGDFLTWPAQFGAAATLGDQTMIRMEGLWIGVKNYNDPVAGKVLSPKVVASGPRDDADRMAKIFPVSIKLIGKYPHPTVTVITGGVPADGSFLSPYESGSSPVDEYNPTMAPDRMVVVTFNTSLGITVTRRAMVFANTFDGNYIINDWVFKNTGIYNANGDIKEQTLDSTYVYFIYRYAFSGEGNSNNAASPVLVGGVGQLGAWASFASEWGISTLNHDFGNYGIGKQAFEDPSSPWYGMRGFYSYYGPDNNRAVKYDEDWGCPAQTLDGRMCAWKFSGNIVLHADKSQTDRSDNTSQPVTSWFLASDISEVEGTNNQYNIANNAARWNIMVEGHPSLPHDSTVQVVVGGSTPYAAQYNDSKHGNVGGGVSQGQGFGPYISLAPGDSIHIVFAQAVGGMSREKELEVGANWIQYYKGSGTPDLIMPNGSSAPKTLDGANSYKKAWVFTGRDSLVDNWRKAMNAYSAGYNIPQPPPPPQNFTVTSLGDKINLQWSEEAESDAHFNGYVIYRSEGTSMNPLAKYEKVFECDRNSLPSEGSAGERSWDDTKAARGFDYYYYVQTKDDGTQVIDPLSGAHVTLYSSLEWTVTTLPARLQRPPVPDRIPFTFSTMKWIPLNDRGIWSSGELYFDKPDSIGSDEVTYGGAQYVCIRDSLNSTVPPDQADSVWKKISMKGTWSSGTAYNPYDAVVQNNLDYYTPYQISGGQGLDLVRVVPNPYDARSRVFQFGTTAEEQDKIAFYGLPADCTLKIFTERGDLIYTKHHTGTSDEVWYCTTTYGQVVASGIYILLVQKTDGGSIFRKFVIIR